MPFLWCFNEALLLQGSLLANLYAVVTALVAALLIAKALQTFVAGTSAAILTGAALFAGALIVGSSTIWMGAEAALTMVAAAIGVAVLFGLRKERSL